MVNVFYATTFVRQYDKLPRALQEEAREKISLFRENPMNPVLRSHKLKGRMRGYFSFSVNFKYRIVYEYDDKNTIALLAIGDHGIYE